MILTNTMFILMMILIVFLSCPGDPVISFSGGVGQGHDHGFRNVYSIYMLPRLHPDDIPYCPVIITSILLNDESIGDHYIEHLDYSIL